MSNCSQDSRKVCTKLLFPPDNAKKKSISSPSGDAVHLNISEMSESLSLEDISFPSSTFTSIPSIQHSPNHLGPMTSTSMKPVGDDSDCVLSEILKKSFGKQKKLLKLLNSCKYGWCVLIRMIAWVTQLTTTTAYVCLRLPQVR